MGMYDEDGLRKVIKETIKVLNSIDLDKDQIEFEGLEIDAEGMEIETTAEALSSILEELSTSKSR